jgi:hypothetical protein
MDNVPFSIVNKEVETKQPVTFEEIEALVARINCNSISELEIIKKKCESMLKTSSWITFYLISDVIKKIDRILYKQTMSPEKTFSDICNIVSYINNYYTIDFNSGECFVKRENNHRNINSFKTISSLYI